MNTDGMKAVRKQGDGMGDAVSNAARISFEGTQSLVRPEYADEADINILLRRYGINQQLKPIIYGKEIDDSLDLQTALGAIEAAKSIKVPEELRGKFNNWQEVLAAAETGQYQYELEQLAKQKAEAEAAKRASEIPTPEATPKL